MKRWGKAGLGVAIFSAGVLPCAIGLLVLFRLRNTTTVTGHVLNFDGHPVGGATIYIQSCRLFGGPTSLQTTRSVSDGTFRFNVADLHAIAEIYARSPGRGIGVFRFEPDNFVTGGSLRDIAPILRLGPIRRVTARVVDSSGKPVVGVNVGPVTIGVRGRGMHTTASVRRALGMRTDSNGCAMIDSLPLAAYSTLGVDDDRFELVEASVPPPFLDEVTIRVRPACRVEGTVTLDDAPLPGLVLTWSGRGTSLVDDWVVTDKNGKFQIMRATKGRVNFEDATCGRREDDPVLPDTNVTADPAATRHVEIKMQRGTLVQIKVVDSTGKPVGGVRVQGKLADPHFYPGAMATRKAEGWWGPLITAVDGTTHVRLTPQKYYANFSRLWERMATGASVDVGTGPMQDIVLTLPQEPEGNRLRVRAIDAEGNPLRSGVWYQSEFAGTGERTTMTWPVAKDGTADFDTDQPRRSLLVVRAQCGDELSDLVVPPKNGLIVLNLHHVGFGAVRGVVRDESGSPIAGAEVQLNRKFSPLAAQATDIYPKKVITGPDGRFILQGLYPGLLIALSVQAVGYKQTDTLRFEVARGETKELSDIVLSPLHLKH